MRTDGTTDSQGRPLCCDNCLILNADHPVVAEYVAEGPGPRGFGSLLLGLLIFTVALVGIGIRDGIEDTNVRLVAVEDAIRSLPAIPPPTTTSTTLYPPDVSGLVCAPTSTAGEQVQCLPVPKPTVPLEETGED
jgi:hypothetical protein